MVREAEGLWCLLFPPKKEGRLEKRPGVVAEGSVMVWVHTGTSARGEAADQTRAPCISRLLLR